MALQHERVVEVADRYQSLAERAQELVSDIQELTTLNSNLAIDWGAGSTPAYINEEPNGNLLARTFSRQEVSNAIFSLQQIVLALTNQAIAQGDHLGNLNKLANP